MQLKSILVIAALVGCGAPQSESPRKPVPAPDAPTPTPDPTPTPAPDDPPPAAGGPCEVGGCSGTLCLEAGLANDIATTCEFKARYACYRSARCERQTDGQCAWTQTPELAACLQNPPPVQ